MRIDRVYTTSVSDPYDLIEWTKTDSEIRNPDGGVVFSLRDIEVPKGWSKVAADVLAQKYFRKAGVPAITRRVPEDGVPNWLQKSVGVEAVALGSETSAKQVFDRLAGAWTYWGWKMGMFDPSADQLAGVVVDPRAIAFSNARAYFDEMRYMLAAQIAAPNSPQWFNTGLHWAYGIDGPSQGHYYYDTVVGEVVESKSSYERPQPHACFIQSVADDLVNDGGIMDLWTREARLFKYGSGTGSNFSAVRGENEKLSGGGKSSGLMSFLKIGDASAGAIKSGGTCLIGSTPVMTERGFRPVSDLVDQSFIVFSMNPKTGRVSPKRANAFESGVKQCVRVVTDKGEFELSYDHPFLMKTGRYVQAGNLRPGDRLSQALFSYRSGYPRVCFTTSRGVRERHDVHRMIAKKFVGDIEGMSVHHRDEDITNADPRNLHVMSQSEHARLHGVDHAERGEHVFVTERFHHVGSANGMHSSSKFWKNTDKVRRYVRRHTAAMNEPSLKGRLQQGAYTAQTQKMINTAFKLIDAGFDISTWEGYKTARKANAPCGRAPLGKAREAIEERFGSYDRFYAELETQNHRVLEVVPIGKQVVYDVQVRCSSPEDRSRNDRHNFAIGSRDGTDPWFGYVTFVHNTRRAAKMVVLDVDHPDAVEFVQWKSREEDKVAALVTGSKVVKKHVRSIMRACINCEGEGDSCFDPKKNPALHKEIRLARRASVPDSYIHRTVQLARQGISEIDFDEFSLDWGSEAYTTVSGQNSNNSVRVSDAFMEAVNLDAEWKLKARLTGETMRVVSSRDLWDKIGYAAWSSADPGVQYDTTINDWHTCSVDGRINASNPCCFVAGTFVDTSEGLIDIAELTRMKRRGETLPLAFSYDFDKGGPVLRQINNAWKAGVTRNLVEVRTEKGQRIRCTPEHVWYLRDGTEVQAKDLQPGMSLRKIKRGANPHRSGRISILSFPDSRSERGRCSQARWMWKQVFGDIPEGFEVHHRNEDPTDDRISNFKLVEGRRHRRFHARGLRNPRAIDVSSEVLVEVFDTIASQDRKTHKRRDGVSPAMWNSYIRRNNLRGKVPMAASPTLGGRIRGMEWDAFVSQMEEARYDVNDRVKRVKNIVLDSAVPVYDIEVEGTHNFGIRDDQDGSKSSLIVSNSEYMFLDDTACNLASLNLKKFGGVADFDVDRFRHAVRLWTITLEISVEMAQFPSREIALRSYKYRTLGLGYANVGGMLMSSGVGYDSRTGRAVIGAVTAIMTGEAYATSARMAEQLGPFVRYEANKDSMERVIRNHRAAAQSTPYAGLSIEPPRFDYEACSMKLAQAAWDAWDQAHSLGLAHGYRNAQVSCIAPTGCTLSTTRIRTEDGIKSYREILEENDIDWKEIEKGNDQRWIPLKPFWLPSQDGHRDYADKIWYNGIQETYVVTFEDGTEFECTGNHKLLVRLSNSETAWIEAQYLNGDEEVLSS